MKANGQDKLFHICYQLLRIDNRPVKEISEQSGISLSALYKLKKGQPSYMRSSTAAKIAHAMHKTFRLV